MILFENFLIFPAPRYPLGDWSPAGLDYQDVDFASADGTRLHGWHVEHPQPRVQILYCHGNAEHVADQAGLLRMLQQELQASIFAFDYRGYGRSEGSPDEAGVLADGQAAQAWLAENAGLPPEQLVYMGRSLGGAVAIDLASRTGARAVIVESTFPSLPDVAQRIYWWAPIRWLMRTRFASIEKIRDYHGPLLQSHTRDDEIIPLSLARQLFEAAGSQPKRFLEFPGGHNDPPPASYLNEVVRFLRVEG